MGGVIGKIESSDVWVPETILDTKIKEAMQRRETQGSTLRSFNRILLKFPKIDKNLRKCKDTFQEFDEDRNGAIDPEELKHCFRKLQIIFTDEEIDELFKACDINDDMVIKFNEFIVLLCIVYLLKDDLAEEKSRIGLPKLEATFETLVDAFVFLDKNKDGYVSRSEMIESVNESGEQSGMIAMKRFDEMDWDHNGTVNFKEFLFAFTSWVGIDDNEDEGDENVEAKPRHP
ncbi:calmodulin-related [Lithospermum erythrorhizon]|uniref:Calmodulin-related n=1 Tax=Lithospermum erythrorhizon TaxID=34254 RepID=A0AAV3RET2_LITER